MIAIAFNRLRVGSPASHRYLTAELGRAVRNRIEAGLTALRENPADPAIWLGAVVLIVYLSLRAGGYDPIPRDEVGIIVWWGLLVGVAVGALSIERIGIPARGGPVRLSRVGRLDRPLARLDAERGAHRHRAGAGGDLPGRLRARARGPGGAAMAARSSTGSPPGSRSSPVSRSSRDSTRSGFRRTSSAGSCRGSRSSAASPIRSTTPARSAPSPRWRCRCCSPRAPRRGPSPARLLAAAAIPVAGLAFYLTSSGTATVVVVAGLVVFFLLAPDRLPKLATLGGRGGRHGDPRLRGRPAGRARPRACHTRSRSRRATRSCSS